MIDDEFPTCPICGAAAEWSECWRCDGAKGYGPGACEICHGTGGYRECTRLPHTAEQLAANQVRKGTL